MSKKKHAASKPQTAKALVTIANALFRGKTFLDCAIAIRKMESPKELLPYIAHGLGLTDSDIRNCPVQIKEDIVHDVLSKVPNEEDELYGDVPDMISDAMYIDLSKIVIAMLFTGMPRRDLEVLFSASEKDIMSIWASTGMKVSMLNRQASFLWHSFRNTSNTILFVTDDARNLVDHTKFDEKVTEDMFDRAFPNNQDIFISMKKPYEGYCEFAVLRRDNRLSIVLGPKMVFPTYAMKAGVCDTVFSCVSTIDMMRQFGGMTADSIASSSWENNTRREVETREKLIRISKENDIDPTDNALTYDQFVKQTTVDKDTYDMFTRDVAAWMIMFAMKLRLLMTAEKTPIEEVRATHSGSVSRHGVELPPQKDSGVRYSVVSLTKEFYDSRARYEKTSGGLNRDGKSLVEKQISGFLRKQHYGPRNSLSKFIYIDSFTNRFWVNDAVHVARIVK